MVRAFLTAYPWDLIDEGVGTVLDRLHGEVGVTGLSLWAATPPLTQLRVHDVEPRVFRTRGGLFFQPSDQHYAAARCKPVVSGWLKGRNPLAKIAEACTERALELRVILSAAATGRIAGRHPEMACKNVFGAESQTSVCLANPDVQTYLCGLAADLSTGYDLAGISIADFTLAWHEAFERDLLLAIPLGDAERSLLGICFCESCNQKATAAGVDVASAKRSVQVILERSLRAGTAVDKNLSVLLADNEPLAAYSRWRTGELSALLQRIKDACRCELLLIRSIELSKREGFEGLDLGIPDAVVTRIEEADQLSSALLPGVRRSELRLPASFAIGQHGAELVSLLARAAELGFHGVEIDNYGLLPDAALTPIKQAIRFARRTASD